MPDITLFFKHFPYGAPPQKKYKQQEYQSLIFIYIFENVLFAEGSFLKFY